MPSNGLRLVLAVIEPDRIRRVAIVRTLRGDLGSRLEHGLEPVPECEVIDAPSWPEIVKRLRGDVSRVHVVVASASTLTSELRHAIRQHGLALIAIGRGASTARLVGRAHAVVARDDIDGADLASMVHLVARGYLIASPTVTNALALATDEGALTERARDVARSVGRGMTNAEIARACKISEPTVKRTLRALKNELGLRTRLDVAAWAHEQGLVS